MYQSAIIAITVSLGALYTGNTTAREQSANIIEEIEVHGTKKSGAERLQEVPSMISVFSGQTLDDKQVSTLEDLSFASPNVSLDAVGTLRGVQNFSIRGLGINSSIPSVDPTVGVFNDGVYLGVTYGVVMDTIDLESIEIFRGPQGLLFGRNVTGGAVLLRSKRPSGEYGASTRFGFETGPLYKAAVSVEGPLAGKSLAGRLSVHYKNDQGYFDNLDTPGRDVGREQTLIIRPVLTFKPNEIFETTLLYEHGETDGDGATPQHALNPDPGDISDNIETNINTIGLTDLSWDQLTSEINIATGNGLITNIFGYREVSQEALSDIDGSPFSLFDASNRMEQDQISNELRYSGRLTDNWDITAGLYYFNQTISYRESRSLLAGAARFAGGGDQDHGNYGVFLANDLMLNAFTVTAGVRYTREKKEVDIASFGFCDVVSLQCRPDFSDSHTWSNISPKLGVSWDFNKDGMVYAHWVRGFRSGGYNFRSTIPAIIPPGPTREEKQDSFEIGVKAYLLERRIRLNLAAFFNRLNDLQREVIISDPVFGLVQGILNTADATITGFEIDTLALISSRFSVNASLGYLDGDYTMVRFDLNEDGVVDGNDETLRIPRLPEWTLTLGADYRHSLGKLGLLHLNGDYSYRSTAAFTDNNLATAPAYNLFNFSIGLTSVNEKWRLTAYGKNLTDEAIAQSSTVLPFAALGAPRFTPLQKGRRFGVEMAYRY